MCEGICAGNEIECAGTREKRYGKEQENVRGEQECEEKRERARKYARMRVRARGRKGEENRNKISDNESKRK